MSEPSLSELEAAATAYETLHVPALFEEWTAPVLELADVRPGDRLLDVACGTGVLARAASRRMKQEVSVVGLDPNAGMLVVAERLDPTVDWRQGTAGDLPFSDASFDVVVSQFGLMFFPDRAGAIREMARVLVPGGRLAVAVWDVLDSHPAYAREVDLLDRLAGKAAGDALRAPFVLGDPAELKALFRGAGIEGLRVVTRTGTARFPSVRSMVEADLRGWLPVMGVHLSEEKITEILGEAETELAEFVGDGGEVVFDSPAHVVVGRSPG